MDAGRNPILTRRGFLGAGAAGLAAITASALAIKATRPEADYRAIAGDGPAPDVLTWSELAVLTLAADRIIAPSSDMPSVQDTMTARRIDRELAFANTKLQSDMKASLAFLEVKPLLSGKFQLFSELAPQDQTDLIAALSASPGTDREIYAGLKFFVGFFYYTDERTWAHIGYSGPAVPEKHFEAGNRIANLTAPKRAPPS